MLYSLSSFKAQLVPNIAENFPDSVNLPSNTIFPTDPSNPGGAWPLNAVTYGQLIEKLLPKLINRPGWFTYDSVRKIYHYNAGTNAELDHLMGAQLGLGYPLSAIPVNDFILTGMLAPLYRGMGIPESEMSALSGQISNQSGSNSANTMFIEAGGIVTAVVASYGIYSAFTAPAAATGLPPAEGIAGGPVVNLPAGVAPTIAPSVTEPSLFSSALAYAEAHPIPALSAISSTVATGSKLAQQTGLIPKPEAKKAEISLKPEKPASQIAPGSFISPLAGVGIGAGILLALALL